MTWINCLPSSVKNSQAPGPNAPDVSTANGATSLARQPFHFRVLWEKERLVTFARYSWHVGMQLLRDVIAYTFALRRRRGCSSLSWPSPGLSSAQQVGLTTIRPASGVSRRTPLVASCNTATSRFLWGGLRKRRSRGRSPGSPPPAGPEEAF